MSEILITLFFVFIISLGIHAHWNDKKLKCDKEVEEQEYKISSQRMHYLAELHKMKVLANLGQEVKPEKEYFDLMEKEIKREFDKNSTWGFR